MSRFVTVVALLVSLLAVPAPVWARGGHGGGGHGGGGYGGHGHGGHGGWHGGGGHFHGGGHPHGGYYGGWRGGIYLGSPWWDPWYGYPAYRYYPPPYYSGPSTVVVEPPREYIERSDDAPADSYWYYCESAGQYYPKVRQCREGWIRVPPSSE